MSDINTFAHPMRCTRCRNIHDAAKVTVVQRYSDCSVWRCPNCDALIDDRPRGWGGSAEPVKADEFGNQIDWRWFA